MLKLYFDGRNSTTKNNKVVKDKEQSSKLDGKYQVIPKIYSSNYVVSKYEKLKATGKIKSFEDDLN